MTLICMTSEMQIQSAPVVALSEAIMSTDSERTFPKRYVHPALRGFPDIPEDAEARLESDIKLNGQQRPVSLYQGYVFDGRARYRCCLRLRLTPKVQVVRLQDPVLRLIQRNDYERYGDPGSAERKKVVRDLSPFFDSKWKRDYLDRRAQFIADSRDRFKDLHRWAYPEPCAVCGLSRDYSHAHHSLPLSYQFDLGFEEADQTFDWVCGVHHTLLHRLVNREIIGSGKSVPFADNRLPEIQKALRLVGRALEIFVAAGGTPARDRNGMLSP